LAPSPIAQVAEALATARRVVAFTGAGISTESGIPDFRSPGGIWARSRPVYYDDFLRSADSRYEYWRQKAAAHQEFIAAQPNPGHQTLARWEAAGKLAGLITQNIDGLHQIAGSRSVWELHGTAREIACLECRERFAADPLVKQFQADDRVPNCPQCGGLLKHATISFGQQLDTETIAGADALAREADVFLAIGSSLVVYPAAGLPQTAQASGAMLVILNHTETPLDPLAEVVIREGIGETLTAIDREVARMV
jgi:NAD-dependent deacetylase